VRFHEVNGVNGMGACHGGSLVMVDQRKRGGVGQLEKSVRFLSFSATNQVRHSFGIRATTNRLGMMSRTGSGLGQQEAENKRLWG